VAYNFNCLFETKGLLKVTDSLVYCKYGNVFCKKCKMESLLLQTTNRKWYMAHWIAAIRMTLSDLQGHSPTARLFECDFFIALCSSSMYVCMYSWWDSSNIHKLKYHFYKRLHRVHGNRSEAVDPSYRYSGWVMCRYRTSYSLVNVWKNLCIYELQRWGPE